MQGFTTKELGAFEAIQKQIGKEAKPTWENCLTIFSRIKSAAFPRTFFWVNSIKNDETPFNFGLTREMGYPRNQPLSFDFLVNTLHPNQAIILMKQLMAVFNLTLQYPNDFNRGCYLLGCKRAFKDSKGEFWLVHQTINVLQIDENNQGVSYFSWFHILGKYNGEPLITEIFHNTQQKEGTKGKIELLNKDFKQLKTTILSDLGFTRKQRQIIDLMATGIIKNLEASDLKKMIATNLEISERSVEGHRSNILNLAKMIFPLNTFKDAVDVVRYLIAQDLVH